MTRRRDSIIALAVAIFTLSAVILVMNSPSYLNWMFERHQNVLSWYIRPLLLLPMCYFAYQRSLTGISVSFFALLTSMFWFPVPTHIDPRVAEFLAMEVEYLSSDWTAKKWVLTLLIPVFLWLLCHAIWKRSIKLSIVIMFVIAAAKVGWSLHEGGASGLSTFVPAFGGFILCVLAFLAYSRFKVKRTEKSPYSNETDD